ncbi:MAG: hypothetical protein R6W73_07230 [Candidatus Saliniplasma sp.]
MEELLERRDFTSKAEFIREIIRERVDDFSRFLHEIAEKDRDKHISIEEYGELED